MDEDLLPISALQHYLYCPRQCALIHLERQWSDNQFTAEGHALHHRVDERRPASRLGVRTETALPLVEHALGLIGVADIVEFLPAGESWHPYPVEYKRGRPKTHRGDDVQLCAQAFCLEQMYEREIAEGALYYGRVRRRHVVHFDAALRALTLRTIDEARALLRQGTTPAALYDHSRCDACSLIEPCQPRLAGRAVLRWIDEQLSHVDN